MKKILSTMLAVLLMGSFAFAQSPIKATNAKRVPAGVAEKMQQHRFYTNHAAQQTTNTMQKFANPMSAMNGAKSAITTFPYTVGFENTLENWTILDNDGDGNNWEFGSDLGESGLIPPHSGNYCLYSASYSGGALTPDNWLISPAITLNDNYELSWYVAAQDPNFPNENYSVYIATGNTVADFNATTAVYTEVIASAEWVKRSVDLTSYNGQTIYIAFRHHNSSDQFMMKIDDIRVGGFSAPDIVVTAPAGAILNDTIQAVATVNGSGATIAWEVDGVTDACTTNTLNVAFDTEGNHTIIATATSIYGSSSDTAIVYIANCGTVTEFPFSEDFEHGALCWQRIDMNHDGFDFMALSEANAMFGMAEVANSGNDAALSLSGFPFLGMIFPMPQENLFVSQKISVTSDCAQFAMFAKSLAEMPDTFAVYATTTMPDTNTVFTAAQTLLPMQGANCGAYALYTADMTSFIDQEVYIVIHHKSAGAGALIIDDVYLGSNAAPIPIIDAPADVRVGRAASFSARSISAATGVTYSWIFDGADDPATADGQTATATWSTPGTYNVTVSASNSEGTNDTTIQFSVYGCEAITEFPSVTDFSAMTELRCWDVIDNNNDGSTWYFYPGLGIVDNSLNFETEEPITPDDYLVSPTYTIPADGHYEFIYTISCGNPEYPAEHYSLYVSTTGNAVEDFTTASIEETLTPNPVVRSISLDAYAGQNINVAIRHHNCSGQVGLVVVNAIVRAMEAPADVMVSGPTGVRVGEEVTYTASAAGAVDSYAWTINGVAQTSTTETLTTTFTEGGAHTVAVTATNMIGSTQGSLTVNVVDCSGHITEFPFVESFEDGLGCWNTIDNDGDGHNWEHGLPENGMPLGYNETNCAASYSFDNPSLSALLPDNWLVSPAIDVPADGVYNVSWMVCPAANPEYMEEHYSVYVATGSTVADFEATTAKYSETTTNPDWAEHAISLSEYAGQTVYVAFRHHDCTDKYVLRIDDVKVQEGQVGIDDVNVEMNLYPNPTTGMVMINADGVEMIQVLDINGRVVMTQANAGELNMSNLSNGVYFVRVITNEGTAVQKIIKH